ncbi:MAG: TraB/GumN family protein [Spirosomaceae bacterium]|nr:TraB/GumN family protein [Spirosomataceae bacterium]
MKKLLFLLLWSGAALAQDKSLLWEISSNGLTKPSYVYGTIHLICPKDYFLTDATKKAITDCEQVYLELDMDDPALMPKMQQMAFFKDGKKIKDYLTSDQYATLAAYFKQKGMNLDMMGGMKPLTLTSMMYMALLSCPPQSYEMVFAQMASNTKKEVLGLETLEAQMGVFDSIPYQKQAEMLVVMAKDGEKSVKEFEKMVATYKAQDVEALLKLMDESEMDFDGYEELLLNNRNAAWIPVMQHAMQARPTFFAVGAAHLGGEKGVLQLLRKQGYTVRAVL